MSPKIVNTFLVATSMSGQYTGAKQGSRYICGWMGMALLKRKCWVRGKQQSSPQTL